MSVTLSMLVTPDGLNITAPGQRIVDQWGNTFALVPALDPTKAPYQVAVNGVVDVTTQRVTRLYSYARWCCHANADGAWWYANASRVWVPWVNPTKHSASPNGTVITTQTAYLWDAAGRRFSLRSTAGGQVAINDVTDVATSNAVSLTLVSGVCRHTNAAGSVYAYGGTPGTWTLVSQPAPPPPAPGPTGAYYHAGGGQILDPSGKVFRARGINAAWMDWPDNQGTWIQYPLKNLPACTPLLDQFPGLTYLRLPAFYSMAQIGRAQLPALKPYLDALAAKGIVVEVECHIYPQVLTGGTLDQVCQWYASIASAYKAVPQIIFGCQNEPQDDGQGSISRMNVAIYNAIRNTGNGTLILGSGNGQYETRGLNAADFAGFKNWGWGLHIYNWMTGNTTDATRINADIAARIGWFSAIRSADGATPVVITEFGDATDGQHPDPGWQAVVDGCYHNPGSGYAQWLYNPPNSNTTGDNLIAADGVNLTPGGQRLRNAIAAGY
jgi:hypothetical protein